MVFLQTDHITARGISINSIKETNLKDKSVVNVYKKICPTYERDEKMLKRQIEEVTVGDRERERDEKERNKHTKI